MFRKIFALIKKEFITILNDKKSRIVLILPPLVQILVFGYAANFDLNHVPYAIYNEDHGIYSRELFARFAGSDTFSLYCSIQGNHEIKQLIDMEKVSMVIHTGQNFSKKIARGEPAELQVILDGRNSNSALITLNYVNSILEDFNTDLASRAGQGSPPARLVIRSWFNSTLNSHWFIIPGIVALLTMVVTLELTALSISREREMGTFDQLMVTPMTPFEILAGKSIPGFLIGIIEATFIILMIVLWFKIPFRGSILALYFGLFSFLISAIGTGLMISSISVTQQQGLMGAFLFLVPAVILSGFATPISNMPEFIQFFTYLNPMRYFLIIVRSTFLEGAGMDILWPQYWPMLVIGATTLVAAGIMFRKRMY